MIERQKIEKVNISCICGNKAQHTVGTIEHTICTSHILIHNIPHFHCHFCGKQSYDINMEVTPFLKLAYEHGVNEFDWEQRESLMEYKKQ